MSIIDYISISTSVKVPENMELQYIYRNGQVYEPDEIEYLGKGDKIKSGYYYVYLAPKIYKNKFKEIFNSADYDASDSKIQTIINFIEEHDEFDECINKGGKKSPKKEETKKTSPKKEVKEIDETEEPIIKKKTSPKKEVKLDEDIVAVDFESINKTKKTSPKKKNEDFSELSSGNKNNTDKTKPIYLHKSDFKGKIKSIKIETDEGYYEWSVPIDSKILMKIIKLIEIE